MSSKTPTVRQINWFSIIPHFIIMGIIILIWHILYPQEALLYGVGTYLLLSFSLRSIIPRDHRKGIKKSDSAEYQEAITHFQKSYDYFKKNEWIDKYRFIALLCSSNISYREMALANIAFCYSQIGEGEKVKEYYEKTLKEFPDSKIAKTALNLINSIKETQQHKTEES